MKSINWQIDSGPLLRVCILAVVCVVLVAGLCFRFFAMDFTDYLPGFSLCPFHFVTGLPCPGCGMTRALLCLGQLRFQQTFEYNPFSIPLFLAMIVHLFYGRLPAFLQRTSFVWPMLVMVTLVWVMRLVW